jgi:hypothetical protein
MPERSNSNLPPGWHQRSKSRAIPSLRRRILRQSSRHSALPSRKHCIDGAIPSNPDDHLIYDTSPHLLAAILSAFLSLCSHTHFRLDFDPSSSQLGPLVGCIIGGPISTIFNLLPLPENNGHGGTSSPLVSLSGLPKHLLSRRLMASRYRFQQ